ncbi:MAG: crosslink repair DNA glycosylase YcaQ family protein [Ilumatobacteraceae bacterium]
MVRRRPDAVELSTSEARAMAIGAQGLADRRPSGRIDRRHLRRVFERVNVIQVDSVNVLVRSQELPLFARLGPHPRSLLPDALADGELFEYWAHMAAIVPSTQHRLFRWRMAERHGWSGVESLVDRRPDLVADVLERVRRTGPLTAGDLQQRVGPKSSWWDWDDGKIALEHLFHHGDVTAIRRRSDFARSYDVPERVLPAAALDAPTPPEAEARAELLVLAARSLGVATLEDLADYHRQKNAPCRPLAAALVAEGRLLPARVEGWRRPAFIHPDATVPRRLAARALLSPFDSLVWNRDRDERLFGFRYRIEIYVPEPKRVYGYYVLPFLLRDRLVGRVDLKADRAAGVLRVQGAYTEPDLAGLDETTVAGNLVEELRSMATWLELDVVAATSRGDLAPALHRAGLAALEVESPVLEAPR